MRTYYDVLGLSDAVDQATIRSTYLRLLQIYHPDHNKDSGAGAKTAELIEAYTTLSNPASRKAYDESIHPTASNSKRGNASDRTTQAPPEEVVCQSCKIQDESLRISIMYWVASVVIVTRRGGKAGIWCEKCRVKQAFAWTSITGMLGWWGIPWGPIYTVHALYFNAVGGNQDRVQNAALLRVVSYQLYQKGKHREALTAIVKSIALEPDEQSSQFAKFLRDSGLTSTHPLGRSALSMLTAVPSLLVVIAIAIGISVMEIQPTGYAARYEPPPVTAPTPTAIAHGNNARSNVNKLVDSLADQIAEHATYVGKRQSGSSTINRYELDRSKYQASGFANIAQQIRPFLEDDTANGNGFASSAYFNAMLMSLSVQIENGLVAGSNVDQAIDGVSALGEDPRISQWLSSSPTSVHYQDLKRRLATVQRYSGTTPGGHETAEQLAALKQSVLSAKAAFMHAKSEDDSDGARIAAQTHDQAVDRYNDLVTRSNLQISSQRGLDLAFNRCLDPKILMSKFEQVDLTSESETEKPAP